MSEPFQILCVSPNSPDLWGSAYGPFVVQHCGTLAEAAAQLRVQPHDAVLIEMRDPAPRARMTARLCASCASPMPYLAFR